MRARFAALDQVGSDAAQNHHPADDDEDCTKPGFGRRSLSGAADLLRAGGLSVFDVRGLILHGLGMHRHG